MEKEKTTFLEFAIIYNDVHIGAVSVYLENDTGELGWIINKNYWGNGFACEAAKALIYSFNICNSSSNKQFKARFLRHHV